ncbi:MAG TPA: PQQ-dependent sugar dehydrogenase [Polyangiales bacterium]|nr:PQQ-dependent sugar dehydrogenase [Polyangiales bacterium]
MPQRTTQLLGLVLAAACGGNAQPANPGDVDAGKPAADGGGGASGDGGGSGGAGSGKGGSSGKAGAGSGGAGAAAVGGGAGAGGSAAAGSGGSGAGSGAGGAGGTGGAGASAGTGGAPAESPWKDLPTQSLTASAPPTTAANATGQTPAFAGQTRAPAPATLSKIKVQTITDALTSPWGVEALRDGRFVVTERGGTLRVVTTDAQLSDPIAGMPEVFNSGQGGLLDVAVDESTEPMTLCITFSKPREDGKNSTAASCTTATGTGSLTLQPLQMVFQQEPAWNSAQHFGSRFVFAPDGLVYITTGERSVSDARGLSQDKTAALGKVIRLKRDGSAPSDNPFAADSGAAPQVWSYGHRNLQAAALDLENRIWTVEHGPRGGDELNMPQAGKNYGWPIITYGIDYSGQPIGDGITQMAGMEQPVYFWDPVIAPSGMLIYSGNLFSNWRGDVFIGGLVAQALVHLKLENDKVVSEERFDLGARVRDVTQGPDGAIYVITENDGRLLRLTPE